MQSKSTSKKIECVEAAVATRKKNPAAEDRLPITCQIQKQFCDLELLLFGEQIVMNEMLIF